MAREKQYTDKQFNALVTEVKRAPGNSERHYSEKTGIPMSAIGKALYLAEVTADPKLKIPATGKGVVAAVKKGTLRWPRIAAYAGISVGAAQKLYEDEMGEAAPSNITGRGRKFDGSAPAKTAGRGKAAPATGKGTSGRRGAAAAKPNTAAGRGKPAAGKRGTRAGADPK